MVGCVICHGGNSQAGEKELAHADLVVDPSDGNCNTCHQDIAQTHDMSLHATLSGFRSALEARGGDVSDGSPLATVLENHCQQCHTTCGQCHVSRPSFADGGLIAGHEFKKVASIRDTCLACHGGRTGPEYQGKNEGVKGDVHWMKGGMPCISCHQVEEFHGDGNEYAHRYDGGEVPACTDCHPDVVGGVVLLFALVVCCVLLILILRRLLFMPFN